MENLTLASDFPAVTEADWLALADKALGGASFETLRKPLYEGVKTEPLYIAGTTLQSSGFPVTGSRGWHVIQPLTGTAEQAKGQLDAELSGGADSFWLDFSDGGLTFDTLKELSALFSKDALSICSTFYLANSGSTAECALLAACLEQNGAPSIHGSAGFDPLTMIAVSGEIPADRTSIYADYVDAAMHMRERLLPLTPFLASDRGWHGAGGSAVHELGLTLAAGVSYWRAMFDAGEGLQSAASGVGFSLTASADIFLTIAKFRAMRLLWHRALAAAVEAPDMSLTKVIAETSPRMLSVYDPHTNLLRGTAAAFGAAIGGANGIRIHPFDGAAKETTPLSGRMARNTSHILAHEARLGAVADAAHGSWYVENLTQTLAAKSWALFRKVEGQGGLAAALADGFVQGELRTVREEREKNVACRKDKITGVSMFPNLQESYVSADLPLPRVKSDAAPILSTPDLPPAGKGERFAALVAAARQGATLNELRAACVQVREAVAAPLIMLRDAEPFEALRRRSDLALTRLGSRPPVFLALLGNAEDYRARSLWVQGFFAAGGIEALMPSQSFSSVEALIAAFRQSPAPVACLCSSNKLYSSMKGAAVELKKAGAAFVYLAGPSSVLKTLDPADARAIDRLIYEGCDAVTILREAQAILRVEDLSANSEGEE